MNEDPDAIGPDGTVRLRCYLPSADTHWLSAHCAGLESCGRVAPIEVPAAIRTMGAGDATFGRLARRLRCGGCGNRRVELVLCSDPRPAWVRERDGPAPETMAEPRPASVLHDTEHAGVPARNR